jgi:glyoxylase-like metal-dependent hydrolase (beta-lactamase superfamily II)
MTGSGNWTWLLRGRVPTLIDAGVGEAGHLDELERALEGQRLAQVLVTHGHRDHAAGATAIARRMPSVRFLKMPWPERDRRWPVTWTAVLDGATIDAGDTPATVIHTPGHSPDHVCLWHEQTRTLFGGDLAIDGTTVWIPVSLGGDLTSYLASLDRVLALNSSRIYPAHGPVIDNPAALLRRYVAHRRDRERQIIDALRNGITTPGAIVASMYRGLGEGLAMRAEETVIAHLQKLERDGVARRDAEAWHMIEP